MARVSTFKFKPFSTKQLKVLTWWLPESPVHSQDGIIADGAIRSGKTVSMALSFVIWSMETFDGQNLGMCGKTIGSFRRNVLAQLKLMLSSRGYRLKDNRTDNLLEVSRTGRTNYFYIFGGKDERSQDLIQGITLAGVFFDEVALMPESFVNQATARCSVQGSKYWFNCNPAGPTHWFKKNWIDAKEDKNLIYLHFTMEDNLSLTEAVKERYRHMYSGVFFDRYIKGLWVLAEGIIFRKFAENPEPYLIDVDTYLEDMKTNKQHFTKKVIGIDFGGNGSKTTFYLTGYRKGYKELVVLEEDDLPVHEDIDAEKICNKYIEFYKRCEAKYGPIQLVQPDSASSTLIYSLISAARKEGLRYDHIKGVKKNPIADRPKTVDLMLTTGRLKISDRCENLIRALSNLRWDAKKKDEPQDINEGNINDYYDAFCYTWITYTKYIDLER